MNSEPVGPFGWPLPAEADYDEADYTCRACGDTEVETCYRGLCHICCDDEGDCHTVCVICRTRQDAGDVCQCCHRCWRHVCLARVERAGEEDHGRIRRRRRSRRRDDA